jgi:hypothetical protein
MSREGTNRMELFLDLVLPRAIDTLHRHRHWRYHQYLIHLLGIASDSYSPFDFVEIGEDKMGQCW